MELQQIIDSIVTRFDIKDKTIFEEESGISYNANTDVRKVGYATNLTPEVIQIAKKENVNLIITHYKAWQFIEGFCEQCMELLEKYAISHYYNHLPLDDAKFGTNSSLVKALGFTEVKKVNEEDGFMCGVIAESEKGYDFDSFVEHIETLLDERVMAWKFNDRPIKKIHIICGGGQRTSGMDVAIEEGCDLYLTGEKLMYTIEYAQFKKLNLVVGSHTFTEIFGVESMSKLIQEEFKEIEVIRLYESHFEARGINRIKLI